VLVREVTVEGRRAHPRPPSDLLQEHVHAGIREDLPGGPNNALRVASSICSRRLNWVLTTWARGLRWLPNLRITVPLDEIAFKQDTTVYGVRELPVTW
jgi:hypothetical protein